VIVVKKGERVMNKEELLKRLEDVNVTGWTIDTTFSELLRIAMKCGAEDLLENFVNYELLEILAYQKLEENSVWGVKEFLNEVTFFGRNVYYIDGYGNTRDVNITDLVCLKEDLKLKIEMMEK
jgi:hypothetical protein